MTKSTVSGRINVRQMVADHNGRHVPPIVANAVLVPFVLRYGYSVNLPIPLMMLTVGAGEIISCGIFGMVLLTALSKYKNTLFGKQAAAK